MATVNGEAISQEAYRTSYNQLLDQVRQSFGANLNDELLKSLNLQTRALDQLIDRTLMKQAAARLKMEVNDDELAQSVRRIPAFQSNGAFDRRRYQQVLSLNRMTPETFEASQRENLLADKLMKVVTESSKVSDTEAEEWYKWNHAAVKVDFACLDADRYKNLSPSKEDVAQFFERMKESYRTEPEIQVRYVQVNPDAFAGAIAVTEQELRDYYDANSERFVIPQTVEARHILIRLPADAAAGGGREGAGENPGHPEDGPRRQGLRRACQAVLRGRGQQGPGRRPGGISQRGHDSAVRRCRFRHAARPDQRSGADALRTAPDQGRKGQRRANAQFRRCESRHREPAQARTRSHEGL